ncbi:hypothetical protein ACFSNO_14545 [Streptomyces cirratus]
MAPRAAAARALAPLALLVRETHDEMDRLRGRLEELVPAYEAGAAPPGPERLGAPGAGDGPRGGARADRGNSRRAPSASC